MLLNTKKKPFKNKIKPSLYLSLSIRKVARFITECNKMITKYFFTSLNQLNEHGFYYCVAFFAQGVFFLVFGNHY